MNVYKQEILDGLSEKIKAQASIAYCAPAVLIGNNSEETVCQNSEILQEKIKANNTDQIDLYYIKSILVSTGWNKNDDVFDPQQTWAAKNTPEDKQFNFNHNENDIIGHITGSYVVDRSGSKILSEDQEEPPKDFDIVTEAVLYNSWTNPENRERMRQIIAEIEDNKWFVSMECLFSGFDYSVVSDDGISKTVSRSEESSFLTKHLRAYGGTGEYEGHKIGRLLKGISFSGKGLVSKPANPRSVILDYSRPLSASINTNLNDVFSKGENNMSNDNTEKKLADLEVELASSREETNSVKAEMENTNKEFADQISSLENTIAEKESLIKSSEERVSELEASLKAKEEEFSELSKAMDEMKKKEKDRMRKEKLVMAGFDEAEAEESINLYDALGDDAFEAVIAAMKKKLGMMKDKMMKDKEEKPKAEESEVVDEAKTQADSSQESDEPLLEEVETTEATLVNASDVDGDTLASTRASVAEWLEQNVLSK